MGKLVINNIGKAYKRYPNRWSRLLEWSDPHGRPRHEAHWVLRGVSFEVAPGESVGIIGANGAGKSTLLKIITGTTQPSQGSVEVRGQIAALLELGMGFHPDFTGRQNVLMAGQLLGLSVAEITAQMPAIEDFAEIGDYIDQPVRTYSSGMQVRLAFSVATTIRPDILIVDEALSVGDLYFQHKSFERIRQFRDQDTTLLFVSHSPGAIKTLCNRAILLDQGIMVRDGSPDVVLDYYNAIIAKQEVDQHIRQVESETRKNTIRSGNQAAVIERVDMILDGQSVRAVQIGEAVRFRIDCVIHQDLEELTVGFLIRDQLGNDVFGTNTWYLGSSRRGLKGGDRCCLEFEFPEFNLGVGNYSVTFALHSGHAHVSNNYDWWNQALVLQVVPGSSFRATGVGYLPTLSHWI
ncbi:MAG: ABC transporter ATP-binding protein [Candidatus Competibacteraceae bacterium]|nr:ABC transporter ATP-binding protein [Candidatus Competibacteraceae bacterium]MCP5124364.1 ABC transporter ATP-binding protein [Gammaproteobacteria bacterium]HRX70010.1 ABC transporter ATP-binding protein [Candidatus Competibacteraceae bacterium]